MVAIIHALQDVEEQVLRTADPLSPFYKSPRNENDFQPNTMGEAPIAGPSLMRHALDFCSHTGHDVSMIVLAAWAGLVQQLAEAERVSASIQHRGTIQSLSRNITEETLCREILDLNSWNRCENLIACDDGQYHIGIITEEPCCQTDDEFLCNRCPLVVTANASQLTLQYPDSKQSRVSSQNIAGMLATAIGSLLVDQDQALRDLQCFTIEHMKLLQTWNGQKTLQPPTSLLHQRIHELAVQQPRQTAVLGPDATLTYAQLDSASSDLALHISSLGVTNDMMVGVSFPKSTWAVVSMLAINKIGAAFVPLDTSHPQSRLEYIIKEAGITWLLTSTEKASSFVNIVQNIHIVSAISFSNLTLPTEAWSSPVRPTDPAYCFFTSGSTGVPKGCVVSHKALSSVSCHKESLRIQASSRVLQFASFSFGIALIEIWCTLTAGATVCMPSDENRLNNLTGAISDMNVSWAFMTATVVGSLSPDNVPSLQTIVIAGEPLQKAQINTWANAVCLVQGYGLTEWAGVCSVSSRVVSEDDQKNIGYAANGRLWVVNHHNPLKLALIGAVGELVIEGPSLASGYLNHPAKTDAAFLVNPSWLNGFPPSSDGESSRVYRTGDLVQYNTDGTLNYVGRKDTQIKIRGQRVEVGEIEFHVSQLLPDAQKVVVEGIRTQGADGQQVLTAFIVTSRTQSNNSEMFLQVDGKLKQAVDYCRLGLLQTLPNYMVPEVFLALQWVPMTVTGKVDRRRLREEASSLTWKGVSRLAGMEKAVKRPTTMQECTLCEIVASVLQTRPSDVGVSQSFFEVGGDSVTAMKMVGLARKRGLNISVNDIFNSPTLGDLALNAKSVPVKVARTDPGRFDLLDKESMDLIQKTAMEQCNIREEELEDVYPCTALQEGLFALSEGVAGEYQVELAYRLHEGVDVARFKTSWEQTIATNPVFRSRIIDVKGKGTYQAVIDQPFEWDKAVDPESYIHRRRTVPVTLGSRLLHAALMQDNDTKIWHFLVTIHHSICDRWSVQLALNNLEAAYNGEGMTHQDFTKFIHHVQNTEAFEGFWKSELEGYEHREFPITIMSDNLTQSGLKTVVDYDIQHPPLKSHEFTQATVLRLALALTVRSYTRSNDVVFGATVTGRGADVPGIEQAPGPTIATVPIRVRLDTQKTLKGLLLEVQNQMIRMMPSEQAGIQNIRKYSRGAEAACQFGVQLITQPVMEQGAKSILDQYMENTHGLAGCPLTFICMLNQDQESFSVKAQYDHTVLDQSDVLSIIHQFEHILCQVLTASDSMLLADFQPGINPEDLNKLKTWNATVPVTTKDCIHDIISRHALVQPYSQAVCSWDGAFTYGELDELSSQLSVSLRNLEMRTEEIVAVCFEKTRWCVVAMLAVLKAGAAVILLEPAYPQARLQEICHQSKCKTIISSQIHEGRCRSLASNLIIIGESVGIPQAHPLHKESNPISAKPHDAAYLIFTSGSTGTPKGIVVEHQCYVSSASSHLATLGIGRKSRVLQFSSYAFDGAILENFGTLMAGGCVCILSDEERRDSFIQSAYNLQITHAIITPSLARALGGNVNKPFTQTLVLCGEKVMESDIRQWTGKCQNLFIAYGPAEASVCAVVANVSEKPATTGCIGSPTGCVAWVVDPASHEDLLPIGSVGELVIEGPHVARGYHQDQSRTAELFISPPSWLKSFRRHGASRLYKTGDLVRYQSDGSLIYCGRKDTQVKIRAQRFELADVERNILSSTDSPLFSAIAEVIIPSLPETEPYLAAFIPWETATSLIGEPNEEFKYWAAKTETRMRERLPGHMVPSLFFPVSHIPRTANGKTDRRMLRDRVSKLSEAALSTYRLQSLEKTMPSTKMGRTLQKIWSSLLGLPISDIGMQDNFLHLGGDSITAMKLVGEARDAGLTLTVSDVLNNRVFSELMSVVRTQLVDSDSHVSPFSLLGSLEDQEEILKYAEAQCKVSLDHIEDILPCTPLQEGLMSISIQQPGRYIAQSVADIGERVDPVRLQHAMKEVVKANQTWRTRLFQAGERGIFQAVIRDTPHWHEATSTTTYLTADAQVSMGFGAPLVRCAMTQENGYTQLVLTLHHSIYDGWSISVIMQQLEAAYHGLAVSSPPFSSFVRYVHSAEGTQEYWQRTFANLNAATFPPLPSASYQPAPNATYHYRVTDLHRERSDYTVSHLVRLAWAIVASQHTGSDDTVFGVTVTGRSAPVPGIEKMTGPTIATFPLRVQLQGSSTVNDCLSELQHTLTEMGPYEQTGLQSIRRFGRECAAACDFQTFLLVQPREGAWKNKVISPAANSPAQLDGYAKHSIYGLCVFCHPNDDNSELDFHVQFDEHLLTREKVDQLFNLLDHVLRQISQAPEMLLEEVDFNSPADCRQLDLWNRILPTEYETTLHEMVLKTCLRQPSITAISAWDGTLTYEELDLASGSIAQALRDRDIGSEDLVGISMEKSRWAPVIFLGVLRAGAACLMLDPALPRGRLVEMSRQAGPKHLIASEAKESLVSQLNVPVTVITGHMMHEATKSPPFDPLSVSPSSAAIVLFTSGSTGTPKALILEHRNLCTSIRDQATGMNVNQQTRGLHFAAYSFDLSIYEMFGTLSCGGCLCIPSEDQRVNSLADFINHQAVNWALLTPSTVSVLRPEEIPCLKTLVLAGEAVKKETVEAWADTVKLVNAYGPAEATICTVGSIPVRGWIPDTIGSMVGSVGWICSPSDPSKLAPIGTIGELVIEGPVVARGYLNDDEKTRASFIDMPCWLHKFRAGRSSKVYRSGDLATYNPDGTLRYMGRKDTQTKLRGQRIELGEVESRVCKAWPKTVDVVSEVIAPAGSQATASLVAFIYDPGLSGGASTVDELFVANPSDLFREHATNVEKGLKDMLPRYMVPSVYIPLRYVPKTATGKVNRRLIRDIATALSKDSFILYRAMRTGQGEVTTESEEILQRIWAKVLLLPTGDVGVQDDFFHLGGDSISAMTVAAMARSEGLSLNVSDIFNSPVLGQLANIGQRAPLVTVNVHPFSLVHVEDHGSLLASLIQRNLVPPSCEISDVLPLSESQHFFLRWPLVTPTFYLLGEIDVPRLEAACDAVFNKHEVLHSLFIPYQNTAVQVIVRNAPTPFKHLIDVDDIKSTTSSIQQRYVAKDTLEAGLPVKFMLLTDSERQQHVLSMRLSHAQYDGVCLPRLIGEIQAAYNDAQFSSAPPDTDFSSFVHYRRRQITPEAFDFWRQYLDGSHITLPLDPHPKGMKNIHDSSIISPSQLTRPIKAPHGFTDAIVAAAATTYVLSQIHRQRSLVVGQTVHSRSIPLSNVNEIIGACLNFIPMRVDIEPEWSVMDLLRHVRHQNSQSIRYDYVDLGDIVQQSTSWASGTKFGYIVQHQNVQMDISLKLGNVESAMGGAGGFDPLDSIWIFTVPRRKNLEVRIHARSHMASLKEVSALLEKICRAIEYFSECPEGLLSDLDGF